MKAFIIDITSFKTGDINAIAPSEQVASISWETFITRTQSQNLMFAFDLQFCFCSFSFKLCVYILNSRVKLIINFQSEKKQQHKMISNN